MTSIISWGNIFRVHICKVQLTISDLIYRMCLQERTILRSYGIHSRLGMTLHPEWLALKCYWRLQAQPSSSFKVSKPKFNSFNKEKNSTRQHLEAATSRPETGGMELRGQRGLHNLPLVTTKRTDTINWGITISLSPLLNSTHLQTENSLLSKPKVQRLWVM